MALFAAVAGLTTASFAGLIRSAESRAPEEVFRVYVREARHLALYENVPVALEYDEEAARFLLVALGGEDALTTELELDELTLPEGMEVTFYRLTSEPEGALSGGFREPRYAAEPVEQLVFHPSGMGAAARIVLTYEGGSEPEVLTLEPFSSGPMVEAAY